MLASNWQLVEDSGISTEGMSQEEVAGIAQALRASRNAQSQEEDLNLQRAVEASLRDIQEAMRRTQAKKEAELKEAERKLREEEKRIRNLQLVVSSPRDARRLAEAKRKQNQLALERDDKQKELKLQNQIVALATQMPQLVLPILRDAKRGNSNAISKLFPLVGRVEQRFIDDVIRSLPPNIIIPTRVYMSQGRNMPLQPFPGGGAAIEEEKGHQVKRRRIAPPELEPLPQLPSLSSSSSYALPLPYYSPGSLVGPSSSSSSNIALPRASQAAITDRYRSVGELIARLRRETEESMAEQKRQDLVRYIAEIEDNKNRAEQVWSQLEKTYDPFRNAQSLIDLLSSESRNNAQALELFSPSSAAAAANNAQALELFSPSSSAAANNAQALGLFLPSSAAANIAQSPPPLESVPEFPLALPGDNFSDIPDVLEGEPADDVDFGDII